MVYVCMCIYGRLFTWSLYVCVYMLPYIHTELHTKSTCLCVYFTYIHRESTCGFGKKYLYMHPVFTCMCVFICIYVYRVQTYMWVCMYLRVDARSLGVGKYVYKYLQSLMGVHIRLCVSGYNICVRIYTRSLHVCVYILVYTYAVCIYVYTFAYMYTEFTHRCVHIYV